MIGDKTQTIQTLLAQTEQAHGAYETAELRGVYDQDWPRWYAAYAVEHGLGDLIGHPVAADALASFLTEGYAAFQQADPPPSGGWTAYLAERIAAEL
jgi:hypothetical protein